MIPMIQPATVKPAFFAQATAACPASPGPRKESAPLRAAESAQASGEGLQAKLKRMCFAMIDWYRNNRFIHDKLYKWINLQCPYHESGYESCSAFTRTAIEKYGVLKGIWLGGWRILWCNPFTAHKLKQGCPVHFEKA